MRVSMCGGAAFSTSNLPRLSSLDFGQLAEHVVRAHISGEQRTAANDDAAIACMMSVVAHQKRRVLRQLQQARDPRRRDLRRQRNADRRYGLADDLANESVDRARGQHLAGDLLADLLRHIADLEADRTAFDDAQALELEN